MFVKYVTNSGWTAPQVGQDIGNLLCGMDISSASASCNKAASTQIGGGNFTMYDTLANASTGGTVITAGDNDGATTKYYRIAWSAASATTYISAWAIEGWNASTHVLSGVGSGQVQASGTALTVGTACTIYIMTEGTAWFSISTGLGTGVMGGEILRDTPFLKAHSGGSIYPPVHFVSVTAGTPSAMNLPKHKNPTLATLTWVTGVGVLAQRIGAGQASPAVDLYDENGLPFIQTVPMMASYNSTYQYAYLGKYAGSAKFGHSTYPSVAYGDTIAINGQDHFISGCYLFPIG